MLTPGHGTQGGGGTGQRRALSRSRLAPPGPGGTDAITWLGRGAIILLVIGAGACLWAALRPLPVPELGPEPAIPAIPMGARASPDVEIRQATLAALDKENLFSAERRPWSRQAMAAAEQDAARQAAAPGAAQAKAPPVPGAVTQVVGGKSIGVTPEKGIPEELKKALAAVELKGVFVTPEGTPVAMIGFVHASNRAASMPYRAGEEFKDEQNPQQPWKIVAIDYPGSRAILSRAGHNVELVLYKSRPAAPQLTGGPGPSASPDAPPEVVPASRDEVLAQLRAARIPEEQIAALLARLDEADSPDARAIQAELARQAAVAAKQGDAAGTPERAAPAGMESVLKMMSESAKSPPQPPAGGDAGQPAERPKRGRRRGDPGPAPSQQPGGAGGPRGTPGSSG